MIVTPSVTLIVVPFSIENEPLKVVVPKFCTVPSLKNVRSARTAEEAAKTIDEQITNLWQPPINKFRSRLAGDTSVFGVYVFIGYEFNLSEALTSHGPERPAYVF